MAVDKFLSRVGEPDVVTFVLFTADWCMKCAPFKIHFLNKERENTEETMVKFLVIDVDDDHAVSNFCTVIKVPTVQVWSQKSLIVEKQIIGTDEFDKMHSRFSTTDLLLVEDF